MAHFDPDYGPRALGDPEESKRLWLLDHYQVLDTPPCPALDAFVEAVARRFDTPVALVSLVDANRQWFRARYGLAATETPREYAFCHHAIQSDLPLIVTDATADPRFKDNPLVTGEPHIRFYAGAPLIADGGARLGTLCVIDCKPRRMTPKAVDKLAALSRLVVAGFRVGLFERRLEGQKRVASQARSRLMSADGGSARHWLVVD